MDGSRVRGVIRESGLKTRVRTQDDPPTLARDVTGRDTWRLDDDGDDDDDDDDDPDVFARGERRGGDVPDIPARDAPDLAPASRATRERED